MRLEISGSHSGCVEINRDAKVCVGQSLVFRIHRRVNPVQRVRPISTLSRGWQVRLASKVSVSCRRCQSHIAHLKGIWRGARRATREGCRKPQPDNRSRARNCDGLLHSIALIWPCSATAASSQRTMCDAQRRLTRKNHQCHAATMRIARLMLMRVDCSMTTIWDAGNRAERCYKAETQDLECDPNPNLPISPAGRRADCWAGRLSPEGAPGSRVRIHDGGEKSPDAKGKTLYNLGAYRFCRGGCGALLQIVA